MKSKYGYSAWPWWDTYESWRDALTPRANGPSDLFLFRDATRCADVRRARFERSEDLRMPIRVRQMRFDVTGSSPGLVEQVQRSTTAELVIAAKTAGYAPVALQRCDLSAPGRLWGPEITAMQNYVVVLAVHDATLVRVFTRGVGGEQAAPWVSIRVTLDVIKRIEVL